MESKVNLIASIAEDLDLKDLLFEIEEIKQRLFAHNKEIIIPIVGEFSSGKTSLLNALSDSKKLETASAATTAVIYEMYFGAENEAAEIIKNDGSMSTINNLSLINNDELKDVSCIRVYDTSIRVPDSTILVDTPGLSSNNPKHIEALSSYLPKADALFLCIDANQQLTKSMADFLTLNSLSHLPLYLIVTKSDTKAPSELKDIKNYIAKNIKISVEKVITISSKNNDLKEFDELLLEVQSSKNEIINRALQFKVNSIINYLSKYLKNLIETSSYGNDLKDELEQKQQELRKLERSIDLLINDVNGDLNESERACCKNFESNLYPKLEEIIIKNSENIDIQAFSAVNTVSNIVFSNFKNDVLTRLFVISNEKRYKELGEALRSLQGVDLSGIEIGGLSYNINLESAGSKTIKNISTGVKVLAGIGAAAVAIVAAPLVVGAATTTGTAAAAGTATAAASKLGVNGALNLVDTATDVANIGSNVKTRKMIANVNKFSNAVQTNMPKVDMFDTQTAQLISPGTKKGFIENIVSKLGDNALGKPQRRKMIDDYMSSTLIPEFESRLKNIKTSLLTEISKTLTTEAAFTIQQYQMNVQSLVELRNKEKVEYQIVVDKYRKYINDLTL